MTDTRREDWFDRRWRPAMGWMYFVVCVFDFIIFPSVWAALQSSSGAELTSWDPLTLKGAGLFHVAMGAVLGVTAWSRGQEKMAGIAGEGYALNKEVKKLVRPIQPPEPEL